MTKFYTNEDEFIFKKEDDKVYILSWNGLEFIELEDEEMFGEGLFDITQCREISKEKVRREVEEYVTEIVVAGKELLEELDK